LQVGTRQADVLERAVIEQGDRGDLAALPIGVCELTEETHGPACGVGRRLGAQHPLVAA